MLVPVFHLGFHIVKKVFDTSAVFLQTLTCRGYGKAPAYAVKQHNVVALFQFLYCKAHRRLSHIECMCRLGGAVIVFAQYTEYLHMSQSHNVFSLSAVVNIIRVYTLRTVVVSFIIHFFL